MCSGGKLKSSSSWWLQHKVKSVAISGKGKATVPCRECLHYLRARNRLRFLNSFFTPHFRKSEHTMFIRRDHFLNMMCALCPTGHFPVCHILLHKREQEMANSQYEAKHSHRSNWSTGAINWSPPETDQNLSSGSVAGN